MNEHVQLELEKIECYTHLEQMLSIPRETLESTIEKQYPDWVRNLGRDGTPPSEDPEI